VDVEFDGRTVSVDVAFGGEFFAVVDADSIGLPVIQESAFDLVRAAERLLPAVDRVVQRRRPGLSLMHGAIFTDSLRSPDYVRSATVLGGGLLLRSPGAASTIALMALWESRGSLTERTFIHESAFGTLLYGTVFARQVVEGRRIIVPTIESPVAVIGSCDAFRLTPPEQ
jgi:proline racemase